MPKFSFAGPPELYHTNEAADKLISDIDKCVNIWQGIFKDEGFSLEARWALYLKVEHLLDTAVCQSKSISVLSDSLYDDFYMERRESSLNSDIDRIILENVADAEEDDPWAEMYAKRDEWREAVLAEGIGGFTNDW